MNYFEPIGDFNENARLMAEDLLRQPVLTLDEACFAAVAEQDLMPAFIRPATGLLAGRCVQGFAKSTKPAHAAQALAIAWVMSYLGLPSAPYILIRGDMKLPEVRTDEGHRRDMALFSPKVFDEADAEPARDQPHDLLTHRWCSTGFTEAETESRSLAAMGQARAWLNDPDGCVTHVVRDKQTKQVCTLDHEMAEPWRDTYWNGEETVARRGFDIDNRNLILNSWEARGPHNPLKGSIDRQIEFLNGSKEAADRIRTLRRRDLAPLAEALHAAGLRVPRRLLNGLLQRRALFAHGPAVLTEVATRQGFNTGWRKPRLIHDLKVS